MGLAAPLLQPVCENRQGHRRHEKSHQDDSCQDPGAPSKWGSLSAARPGLAWDPLSWPETAFPSAPHADPSCSPTARLASALGLPGIPVASGSAKEPLQALHTHRERQQLLPVLSRVHAFRVEVQLGEARAPQGHPIARQSRVAFTLRSKTAHPGQAQPASLGRLSIFRTRRGGCTRNRYTITRLSTPTRAGTGCGREAGT